MDAMIDSSTTARRSQTRRDPTKSLRPRLLVVDDDVSTLSSMRGYLVMKDFDVDVASTVDETELRLLLRNYDLVILPEGFPLIPVIRESNPKTRIVLMTESSTAPSEPSGLSADRVLLEPVQLRDLLAEVTTLLAQDSSSVGAPSRIRTYDL